jgi:hypothetical protein
MEENIKTLIQRYENKIEWLVKHKTDFNYAYVDGCMETYEGVINDLNDLLDGIEM